MLLKVLLLRNAHVTSECKCYLKVLLLRNYNKCYILRNVNAGQGYYYLEVTHGTW